MQPATASQFIPQELKSALGLCFGESATPLGQCIGYVKTRNSNPIVGHPVIDVEAVGKPRSSRRSMPVGNTT